MEEVAIDVVAGVGGMQVEHIEEGADAGAYPVVVGTA